MFSKKIQTKTAAALSTNADKILNIFQSTISGLTQVVADAQASIAVKEEEIKAAQTEKEALETICKKNESVLAKLTAILE
jgi:hypothetical protein